jgi:hypothetical protein
LPIFTHEIHRHTLAGQRIRQRALVAQRPQQRDSLIQ